jgi:hypothetical protein
MEREAISLTPEVIQFDQNHKQLIKVSNHSNEVVRNCYFCLFNTNKYEFCPDAFSLQPREQKLVQVTLKLIIWDGPVKEFAYFKAKDVNKRITLRGIASPSHSDHDKLKNSQSASSDQHPISSREFTDNLQSSFPRNKPFIKKELHQQRRTEEQESSSKSISRLNEISQLEAKVDSLLKEKELLTFQNIELQSQFDQYRSLK